MGFDVRDCKILQKRCTAKDTFDVVLEAGTLVQTAVPGQFVHIAVPGKTLRRPISICDVRPEQGALRIVFQIRGDGTRILSELEEGAHMNVLGPLGNGYAVDDTGRRVLLVGGGIGVPPLVYLAKQFGENASVALGFRSAEHVILEQDFASLGCKTMVVTDDGSYGRRGVVTDVLRDLEFDEIFACGPLPMLKALAGVARERNVPLQVSLEEHMACGVGACLGCACKTRREDGSETYRHVCKDGPVFDYRKLVWN